jgi:hypothetical protein
VRRKTLHVADVILIKLPRIDRTNIGKNIFARIEAEHTEIYCIGYKITALSRE